MVDIAVVDETASWQNDFRLLNAVLEVYLLDPNVKNIRMKKMTEIEKIYFTWKVH